jgi:hypothetical protein
MPSSGYSLKMLMGGTPDIYRKRGVVMRCQNGEKFHLFSILDNCLPCCQQYSGGPYQRKLFVETLPCGEHRHRTNTCPGKTDPKQMFLGPKGVSDSGQPRNASPDSYGCPRIIQVHANFIRSANFGLCPVQEIE